MSLIERLEAAEVGSRALDWSIANEVGESYTPEVCPSYTTSLDAALALAERVLPDMYPGVSNNPRHGDWYGWLGYSVEGMSDVFADAYATTPALALCIAILKAKETK